MHEVDAASLEKKRLRLEAKAMRDIRNRTEWVTAKQISSRAALSPIDRIEVAERWREQGRLFALHIDGQDYFPMYALGTDFHPLPVIEEVLAVFAGTKAELVAAWFSSTSSFLDGMRPLELVAANPERVVAAALNLVDIQQHHG